MTFRTRHQELFSILKTGLPLHAKTLVGCLPRRDSTTERAMSFETISLSSPFLTNDPGTIKTKVSNSGTLTSQSHCNLQISASRQPVLTANNAISARCAGRAENSCCCSPQFNGYGCRLLVSSSSFIRGARSSQVMPCSSIHSYSARFRIRRTTFNPWFVVPGALPSCLL